MAVCGFLEPIAAKFPVEPKEKEGKKKDTDEV